MNSGRIGVCKSGLFCYNSCIFGTFLRIGETF
nr:MAG TPA: hypothetical protein [Caudoviricetes sp.]